MEDAVRERPAPPSAVPESLPVPLALSSTGDTPFRTSPLVTKLALLERGHAVVANARFRRRFLMVLALLASLAAGAGLGVLVGFAVHALLWEDPPGYRYPHFAQVRDESGKYHYFVDDEKVDYVEYERRRQAYNSTTYVPYTANNRRADVFAVASGIGTLLLVPLLLWLFFIRQLGRIPPDGVHIEEQIAGIAQAHPAAVEAWGGTVVLRNRDLVRELLRLAEADARPAR
jgi:hypothetical protein